MSVLKGLKLLLFTECPKCKCPNVLLFSAWVETFPIKLGSYSDMNICFVIHRKCPLCFSTNGHDVNETNKMRSFLVLSNMSVISLPPLRNASFAIYFEAFHTKIEEQRNNRNGVLSRPVQHYVPKHSWIQ
jgi:hypothetical protein